MGTPAPSYQNIGAAKHGQSSNSMVLDHTTSGLQGVSTKVMQRCVKEAAKPNPALFPARHPAAGTTKTFHPFLTLHRRQHGTILRCAVNCWPPRPPLKHYDLVPSARPTFLTLVVRWGVLRVIPLAAALMSRTPAWAAVPVCPASQKSLCSRVTICGTDRHTSVACFSHRVLSLRMNSNRLLIELAINGIRARVPLDTGATLSCVSGEFAVKHPASIGSQTVLCATVTLIEVADSRSARGLSSSSAPVRAVPDGGSWVPVALHVMLLPNKIDATLGEHWGLIGPERTM